MPKRIRLLLAGAVALLVVGAAAAPVLAQPIRRPIYAFGPPFLGPPGFPGTPDTRAGAQTLVINDGEFVLQATATGAYYSLNGGHGPPNNAYHFAANANYLAMSCQNYGCNTDLGPEENARNYFVFDLGGVTGPIFSAYLSIGAGPGAATRGPVRYEAWDVATPISTLEGDSSGPVALRTFKDLGSGLRYGGAMVTPAQDGSQVEVPLQIAALDSILAAEGGEWAVGGGVVPEPAGWALMVLGAGCVGAALRVRRSVAPVATAGGR